MRRVIAGSRSVRRIWLIAVCASIGFAPIDAPIQAQDKATGRWHGAITTPIGQLTLVISLREAADGTRSGDMESIDQAAGEKIPLANVTSSAARLTFSVPSIGATYEADWNDAAQVCTGTFRQGATLPLSLKRGVPAAMPVVDGLDGTWRAQLPRGTANLRLVLHVVTTTYGTRVRLDSPDLGAMGLEVAQFARQRDSVRFTIPAAGVEFLGTMAPGGVVSGTWTRTGQPAVQVTFARDVAAPVAPTRSQWPITIKGYRAEEVSFANAADARVVLAGTLTIPDGAGPFPAVVLISGSGPQDRDETIFGHRPFAVLADYLTRRGIAVLRYDDRGFAKSRGDFAAATSADFATDANAAVRFLLARNDVDHTNIGFVGHSEGGMVGPIAAVANDRVAFVVMLAGPGTRTDHLLMSQRRLMGLSQGQTPEQLDRAEPLLNELMRAVRVAPDSASAVARIRERLTPDAMAKLGGTSAEREIIVSQFSSAWMRYFLNYEPSAILSRLRVPVLAVNGTVDQQVPAVENLAAIRVALAKNHAATVRELPGLNHFFQTARTGALGEYDGIAETFAPSAMEVVGDWILQHRAGAGNH
ncbi:MAG: alpha/beta fold hydrolase [bacterium]